MFHCVAAVAIGNVGCGSEQHTVLTDHDDDDTEMMTA
jgi:hypothetical protein